MLIWRLTVELPRGRTFAEAAERFASRIASALLTMPIMTLPRSVQGNARHPARQSVRCGPMRWRGTTCGWLSLREDGRVVGTWIMGNDYRVKSAHYGGYPAGYLRRVAALFPDRKRVLHVFSGKVDLAAMPGDTVDCNPSLDPTWIADAHDLSAVPLHQYDLVMADPPYSVEDAERYQTTMVKRNVVLRSLARGMAAGSRLVCGLTRFFRCIARTNGRSTL